MQCESIPTLIVNSKKDFIANLKLRREQVPYLSLQTITLITFLRTFLLEINVVGLRNCESHNFGDFPILFVDRNTILPSFTIQEFFKDKKKEAEKKLDKQQIPAFYSIKNAFENLNLPSFDGPKEGREKFVLANNLLSVSRKIIKSFLCNFIENKTSNCFSLSKNEFLKERREINDMEKMRELFEISSKELEDKGFFFRNPYNPISAMAAALVTFYKYKIEPKYTEKEEVPPNLKKLSVQNLFDILSEPRIKEIQNDISKLCKKPVSEIEINFGGLSKESGSIKGVIDLDKIRRKFDSSKLKNEFQRGEESRGIYSFNNFLGTLRNKAVKITSIVSFGTIFSILILANSFKEGTESFKKEKRSEVSFLKA